MRVAIADDSVIVREGLARVLADRDIDVTGMAADARELLELVEAGRPDIAIVDIRMPPTHTDEGLVAADTIRERFPAIGVLVLSQYTDAAYALRLLDGDEEGRGYLLKERITAVDELFTALERVGAGECFVDHELVRQLLTNPSGQDRLAALTPRERDVLALLAEGLTDRGIGARLWLSQSTVETHVRHILQKLDLPTGTAHNRRVHAVLTYLDR
jgi:DNA-binding NarL/FixJ family response regulator